MPVKENNICQIKKQHRGRSRMFFCKIYIFLIKLPRSNLCCLPLKEKTVILEEAPGFPPVSVRDI